MNPGINSRDGEAELEAEWASAAAPDCLLDGRAMGVLSVSKSAFHNAYAATLGWDFATGIGSVNAFNLVSAWR